MIEVVLELVGGTAAPLRVSVRAESILEAVCVAQERHLGAEVRVIFPISPEVFFVKDAAPEPNGLKTPKEVAG